MACGICHKTGHRLETCPKGAGKMAHTTATPPAKPCGYCDRAEGHTPKCPRGRQAAKKAASRNRTESKTGRSFQQVRADIEAKVRALESEAAKYKAALAVLEELAG